MVQCDLCTDNCYVGRTVQPLNKRVNGHRQGFSVVVDKGLDYVNSPDADDTYSLGVHLHTVHGITSPSPKKSCWIHHWLYTLPPPPFRCCTPGLNPPPLINRLGFLPFIISTV